MLKSETNHLGFKSIGWLDLGPVSMGKAPIFCLIRNTPLQFDWHFVDGFFPGSCPLTNA